MAELNFSSILCITTHLLESFAYEVTMQNETPSCTQVSSDICMVQPHTVNDRVAVPRMRYWGKVQIMSMFGLNDIG